MAPVQLKYPEQAYTPVGVQFGYISEKEARAEYTRLRDIAMKRLKRLEVFRKGTHDWVRYTRGRLLKLSEADKAGVGIETLLTEARLFVTNPLSTIKGQKESTQLKILHTLRESGYDIRTDELRDFGKFMDWAKSRLMESFVPSDEIAQLYEDAGAVGVSSSELRRDFEVWLSHRQDVHEAVLGGASAQEIRERLGLERRRGVGR